jgi:diacylglycerol kinase family enzyme
VAALRAWSDHRPVRMGFDGLQASGDHWVSLMEVGIGDRAGGGYRLTPLADPTDGLLDVCLVSALTRWKIPLLIPRARAGRHLNHPKVIYEQVAGFRLRLDSRTLIHLDGELKRLEKGEYSVRVKSKSLRVRIPKDRALALEKKKEQTP